MRSSWCPGVGPLLHGLRSLGFVAATLLAVASGGGNAVAATADPPSCRVVRLADVGWTAETATTAVLGQMLADLGYKPVITVLSVPVTFESMKNGDIDVFLGNWMPTMEADLAPHRDAGKVETVRTNLEGAKYTLATNEAGAAL
ncbi:MAG: glycine betaine ABC transporter substrate-binding protein, partial [Steroidobacteraceae bacterium]